MMKLPQAQKNRREFLRDTLSLAAVPLLTPLASCAFAGNSGNADWAYAADLRQRITVPTFPDRDFLATDFGAVADGKTDCTQAFADAITACSEAGGGRVVVPGGDYLTGPVHLLSNVNFHVSEGATLHFHTTPMRYEPVVRTRWEGTELMGLSPLVYAYEQENVAITGSGTLDGHASENNWWALKEGHFGNPPLNPDKEQLMDMGDANVPTEERIFGADSRLRPSFIQPFGCNNVLIEGIRVRRAPFWQIHPVLCTNLTVRGVDVMSHGKNNDGCNPDSCQSVLIEDCFFDTGDDCIAIKSGRNTDGRRIGVASKDIIVSNCEMKAGHGGVVIGSEMSGGVNSVFVENCRMSSPELWYMLRIKTNSIRGGSVHNVHLRNVTLGTVERAVLRINYHYNPGDIGDFDPRVYNVSVSDVTGENVNQVLSLRGYERIPVRNIRMTDCKFRGVKIADVVEHVEGLELTRVSSDFGS